MYTCVITVFTTVRDSTVVLKYCLHAGVLEMEELKSHPLTLFRCGACPLFWEPELRSSTMGRRPGVLPLSLCPWPELGGVTTDPFPWPGHLSVMSRGRALGQFWVALQTCAPGHDTTHWNLAKLPYGHDGGGEEGGSQAKFGPHTFAILVAPLLTWMRKGEGIRHSSSASVWPWTSPFITLFSLL